MPSYAIIVAPGLILAAAILGAIQGLTEFLPVSSTAHLVIVPRLLNWSHPLLNSLAFDVALHLGTLGALVAVFGREWVALLVALVPDHLIGRRGTERHDRRARQKRLAWGLVLATLPALAAGWLLEEVVSTYLRGSFSVAGWLAVGAIALAYADRRGTRGKRFPRGPSTAEDLTLGKAFLIGCAQALALLPGFSRSGATITAGLLLGLSRQEAIRYSFLLSAPIITAACLYEGRHLIAFGVSELVPVVAGIGLSALVGFAAIRWLLTAVPRFGFGPFVAYRLFLAALIAILSILGGIS